MWSQPVRKKDTNLKKKKKERRNFNDEYFLGPTVTFRMYKKVKDLIIVTTPKKVITALKFVAGSFTPMEIMSNKNIVRRLEKWIRIWRTETTVLVFGLLLRKTYYDCKLRIYERSSVTHSFNLIFDARL